MNGKQLPYHYIIGTLMVLLMIAGGVIISFYSGSEIASSAEEEYSFNNEMTDFDEAVEAVNRLAKAVVNTAEGSGRRASLESIGEMLKDILESEYANQLTNDTFNSKDFFVELEEYPVSNGLIRKIVYTVASANDMNGSVNWFFLQYVGNTTYFSEVKVLFRNRTFYVFENDEGCFVFQLALNEEKDTFATNKQIRDANAVVYVLKEQGFDVKDNIKLPFRIASLKDLVLTQQGNNIKAMIAGEVDGPECIFKSETLEFELSGVSLQSETVAYEIPGVLLGLSDSKGALRTLHIRNEEDRICVDEYSSQVIVPGQDQLYAVKPYFKTGVNSEDESGDEYGWLDIQKLFYAPLGTDLSEEFDRTFDFSSYSAFYTETDIPLYIGQDYICYIQQTYMSGGGTFRLSYDNIRFEKLNTLADYKTDDGFLVPDFEGIKLADLVYGNEAQGLYQTGISTYGGNLQPTVDFGNLAIKRNSGKWSLMLPIMNEYYHHGNGSVIDSILAFAVYDNNMPDFLKTDGNSMEAQWRFWDAKDYFGILDSKVSLYLNDYTIELRGGDINDPELILSIPAKVDEYIVSINFADAGQQSVWEGELRQVQ